MRQSAKFSSKSDPVARWILASFIGWMLFLALVLVLGLSGCTNYNPAMFPSYDVLNPGPEVRLNPLSVNPDGTFVINSAFLAWVQELKAEIIKLRKGK